MDIKAYMHVRKKLNVVPEARALVLHLFIDLFLLSIIYLTQTGSFYLLSQLLLPVFMFRMFALMHECIHGALSTNELFNEVIGVVCGALCLLPYSPWKKIHLQHHLWSGNVDKDPSMGLIKKFDHKKVNTNKLRSVLWRLWVPWSAISQHMVFWSKSYNFILEAKKGRERLWNVVSIVFPVLVYAQINWFNNLLGLFLYLMLVEVVNFPHHLQMPMFEGKKRLNPHLQYKTTRSCSYPSWFARNVLNNFNLHIEHHLFPNLPWYRLQEVQPIVKSMLNEDYTEVKNNGWIIENRRKNIDAIFGPNFEASEDHQKVVGA